MRVPKLKYSTSSEVANIKIFWKENELKNELKNELRPIRMKIAGTLPLIMPDIVSKDIRQRLITTKVMNDFVLKAKISLPLDYLIFRVQQLYS